MKSPIPSLALIVIVLSGCSSPAFVNRGAGERAGPLDIDPVSFTVHKEMKSTPPDCLLILPLKPRATGTPRATEEDAAKVRLSLFAHLSVQSRQLIRLERIDHVFKEVGGDRKKLSEQLKCDAVMEGDVLEYGNTFLGIYSSVTVGADLKIIRSSDDAILWEAVHTAASRDGSIPIDPVGLVMGVVGAASNIREEQIQRVTEDLARRVSLTIPDVKLAAMENSEPVKFVPKPEEDDLTEAMKIFDAGDDKGALLRIDAALKKNPKRAEAWFQKGRIHMLDRAFDKAEPALIRAVALNENETRYLDALGAVNAEKGDTQRALAAYAMAIKLNREDGFAWYNTAIIHFNAHDKSEAASGFYAAGLAWVKAGDGVRASKALKDLKEMSDSDAAIAEQIKSLEDALNGINRRST